MKQSDFERMSQLMADKGVANEAFELLADLRRSARMLEAKVEAYDMLMSDSIQLCVVKSALEGLTDYEGLPSSDINFIQVLRKVIEGKKAYDRLMRGGRMTLKEWANLLSRVVTVDKNGEVWVFDCIPVIDEDDRMWGNSDENIGRDMYEIPADCVSYTGYWKDSLTLPDIREG